MKAAEKLYLLGKALRERYSGKKISTPRIGRIKKLSLLKIRLPCAIFWPLPDELYGQTGLSAQGR